MQGLKLKIFVGCPRNKFKFYTYSAFLLLLKLLVYHMGLRLFILPIWKKVIYNSFSFLYHSPTRQAKHYYFFDVREPSQWSDWIAFFSYREVASWGMNAKKGLGLNPSLLGQCYLLFLQATTPLLPFIHMLFCGNANLNLPHKQS